MAQIDGRIVRLVRPSGAADLSAFLASEAAKRLSQHGQIASTRMLPDGEAEVVRDVFSGSPTDVFLEHERIPFVAYPCEWPPEMLHAAATLTLDVAEAVLPEGFGLKDATPDNILWRGAEPVFVDVLSFERRDPRDSTWLALAQFQRTFLLPLLANSCFHVPLDQVFATRPDGLQPEELYRWAGPWRRVGSPFLTQVSIPVWAGRWMQGAQSALYRPRLLSDAPKARYVLKALFARLRRTLRSLKPKAQRSSEWSGYAVTGHQYAPEQMSAKEEFTVSMLRRFAPCRVLDLGCNTGHFSALAAREGAAVVAVDRDPVVVGAAYQRACSGGLPILPLVLNIARPTPAAGWCNAEQASFLDRASGSFDCVMMLALFHHLLVTGRVPMAEVARLASGLTTDLAIVEFVGREDPMFIRLTRGREHLHGDATHPRFEECCRQYFDIVASRQLPESHRIVYALRKKLCGKK